MAEATPSPEVAAPADAPESTQPVVQLGPHSDIYPESLRGPAAPPAAATPDAQAPEATEGEPSEAAPPDAGPEPAQTAQDTRGSRRKAAEDAYQRGLNEGRAALAREQTERVQRDLAERTQREANERIERLITGLRSADYQVREQSGQDLASIFDSNRAGQAALAAARQEVVRQMAEGFDEVRSLEGVDEEAFRTLLAAPRAVDLARSAFELGQKSTQERIARLEAELTSVRGRLVGSVATPERQNGSSGNAGGLSWDQYIQMSPAEQRKLSSAQIDEITARYIEDRARADGRT